MQPIRLDMVQTIHVEETCFVECCCTHSSKITLSDGRAIQIVLLGAQIKTLIQEIAREKIFCTLSVNHFLDWEALKKFDTEKQTATEVLREAFEGHTAPATEGTRCNVL